MYTYQDLVAVGDDEKNRIDFVFQAIKQHKSSDLYSKAYEAKEYNEGRNTTITRFQKWLYKATGEKIPDIWSANYKMPSNFLHRFVTQKVQYLLGNGVSWGSDEPTIKVRVPEGTKGAKKETIITSFTGKGEPDDGYEYWYVEEENEKPVSDVAASKLGNKKYPFDNQLVKIAKHASLHSQAFGFFNLDHVEMFTLLEFVPLYDEEDGALKAGIRFWQIDPDKPLRATLYEIDGYTEFMWKDGAGEVREPKRPYKFKVRTSIASGVEIYDGENYPTFPIVPMWGNSRHQSDLDDIRSQIDCFDLVKSGFANTIDEASFIYWTLQNAGGMDDIDLAEFLKRVRELHAVVTDDAVTVQPNSIQPPFDARETLLKRLEKDLYRDAMALDVETISSGAATATEIKAAYEPLNIKCDDFEYCVIEFIQGILAVAGIEDEPTFTRSMLINVNEDVQTVLQAAEYLDPDYVTEKILTILGDGDKAAEMLKKMNADSLSRLATGYNGKTIPDNENEPPQGSEGE